VAGGQNAFSSSAFRCIPVHFAHQAELNAHVRLLETKMAVRRKNDESDNPRSKALVIDIYKQAMNQRVVSEDFNCDQFFMAWHIKSS
jgi:hypothetical protein